MQLLQYLNGAETRIRTRDTRIFSPMLYRLSYLGATQNKEATIWNDKFLVKSFLLKLPWSAPICHARHTGPYQLPPRENPLL